MGYYDRLFESSHISGLQLKNRIVFPAIGTHYANRDGTVSQRLIDFYVKRAEGGVGLIVVEFCAIDPFQKGSTAELGVWEDKFIDGLSRLTSAVKLPGSKVALQLHHPGRLTDTRINGVQGVAPSAVPALTMREVPRELSEVEIEAIIDEFVEGARRAKEAGFDAVELHGASGYLIYQFFSPLSNLRKDGWGGNTLGRTRFAREIVRRVKEVLGGDFPIVLRMAVTDYQEGGLTIEESKKIVQIMEKERVDSISVTAGTFDSPVPGLVPPMFMPRGCHTGMSAEIKKVTSLPVMVAGRVNGLKLAEQIVSEGKADLICMGRALIADPDLLKKAKEGREREIEVCVADNTCVHSITRGIPGNPLVCLMNPDVGREGEKETKAEKPRKVLVIGGSPAGVEASRVAALRGHQVILWEENPELGGRWSYLLKSYIPHRVSVLRGLGVKMELGKEITLSSVLELNPDIVIVTMGLAPATPVIPGLEKAKVFQADDVLSGKVRAEGRVAVIGGNNIGMELAEFLMKHGVRGDQISILEEKWAGRGIERFSRRSLIDKLTQCGVRIVVDVKIREFESNRLVFRKKDGTEESVEMDCAVIALPRIRHDALAGSLSRSGLQVLSVNACQSPSDYVEAAEEGASIGREI